MKRVALVFVLLGGVFFSLSAQSLSNITKVGVVDMDRLVRAVLGPTEAGKAYTEKNEKYQEDVKKYQEDFTEYLAELEKLNNELNELKEKLQEAVEAKESSSTIRTMENQIKSKTQALRTYATTHLAELERQKQRLEKERVSLDEEMKKLVGNDAFKLRLNNALRIVAESDGCSLVLNKQESMGLLWSSPSIDITQKVIERLRR